MSSPTRSVLKTLLTLPGSYTGPTNSQPLTAAGPLAVLGLGEAGLGAALAENLPGLRPGLSQQGVQLLLTSPETTGAAHDFAALAEVAGVTVQLVGVGDPARFGLGQTSLESYASLLPGGLSATYHVAQYLAHLAGQAARAAQADEVLRDLRDRCQPEVTDGNPARDLAWTLWGRTPLLLAPAGEGALIRAWQTLLARVGKVLSVPVEHDPLTVLTGAFEARHERGDGRLALLLGEEDAELSLAREVLDTRIDEVVLVPYPGGESGYAGALALWYLGAWTAYYLAEREGTQPDDSPALLEVLQVTQGLGVGRQESGAADRPEDDGLDDEDSIQE